MEPIRAAGLMTGTALDGNVDVALLRTDGETIAELGPYALLPCPRDVRSLIAEAVEAALRWRFEGPEPAIFRTAERALSLAQADAVSLLPGEHGIDPETVGVVGPNGQTVLHPAPAAARRGAAPQLGDGQVMADRLGVRVAFDCRSADAAEVEHRRRITLAWARPAGGLVAFDAGPANGPINDRVRRAAGAGMDRDGALAAPGTPDETVIARHLAHPYSAARPPKSLDRYDFAAEIADGLGLEDGAATLTHFAAAAMAKGFDHRPARPGRLVVSGGGRRNPALMAALAERTGAPAVSADRLGLRGHAVDAECFAPLAVRVRRALPISFPSTTGAPYPLPGGRPAAPSRTHAKDPRS